MSQTAIIVRHIIIKVISHQKSATDCFPLTGPHTINYFDFSHFVYVAVASHTDTKCWCHWLKAQDKCKSLFTKPPNLQDINVCDLSENSSLNTFAVPRAAFIPFYEFKPEINRDYWLWHYVLTVRLICIHTTSSRPSPCSSVWWLISASCLQAAVSQHYCAVGDTRTNNFRKEGKCDVENINVSAIIQRKWWLVCQVSITVNACNLGW